MSAEFGEGYNGYFHSKIDDATRDCQTGRLEITQLWANFLKEFSPLAYEISLAEASDSCEATLVLENIKRFRSLKTQFENIEQYLSTYEQFLEEALRNGNLNVSKRKSK